MTLFIIGSGVLATSGEASCQAGCSLSGGVLRDRYDAALSRPGQVKGELSDRRAA